MVVIVFVILLWMIWLLIDCCVGLISMVVRICFGNRWVWMGSVMFIGCGYLKWCCSRFRLLLWFCIFSVLWKCCWCWVIWLLLMKMWCLFCGLVWVIIGVCVFCIRWCSVVWLFMVGCCFLRLMCFVYFLVLVGLLLVLFWCRFMGCGFLFLMVMWSGCWCVIMVFMVIWVRVWLNEFCGSLLNYIFLWFVWLIIFRLLWIWVLLCVYVVNFVVLSVCCRVIVLFIVMVLLFSCWCLSLVSVSLFVVCWCWCCVMNVGVFCWSGVGYKGFG